MHFDDMPILYSNCVDDYWHKLAPYFPTRYRLEEAKEQWVHTVREGGRATYAIMNEGTPTYASQQTHRERIRKVISFLYAISLPKTKTQNGFDAGAMLVTDPSGHLYTFLKQYPNKTEIKAKSNAKKGPLDKAGYAIDICDNEQTALTDFIAAKKHMYFINDSENNATFIRPESTSRNDISQQIKGGLTSFWNHYGCGTNDRPEYHKHHIPGEVYNEYCKTVHYCVSDRNERKTYKNVYRIATLVNNLRAIKNNAQLNDVQQGMIDYTIDHIYQRCDHPHIRYGDEIILSNDVLPLAYYYTLSQQKHEQNADEEYIQQQKLLLETYAKLRHQLYLLRNTYANTQYAQGHNQYSIITQDIDKTMGDFIEYSRHTATGDPTIDMYFSTIAQRSMGIQQDYSRSARERRMKTEPILEVSQTNTT